MNQIVLIAMACGGLWALVHLLWLAPQRARSSRKPASQKGVGVSYPTDMRQVPVVNTSEEEWQQYRGIPPIVVLYAPEVGRLAIEAVAAVELFGPEGLKSVLALLGENWHAEQLRADCGRRGCTYQDAVAVAKTLETAIELSAANAEKEK